MKPTFLRLLTPITLIAVGLPSALADEPPLRDRRTPVVEVFEHCRNAVVNISTARIVRVRSLRGDSPLDDIFNFGAARQRDQRVTSVGSGAVVHASGYIVTNAHVVAQASDVQVTFADKRTLPADVIAVDTEHDLAVLKVSDARPLPAVKLGRSNDLMIGETVVAIGNPLGLQHTVTAGIISALDRELAFGGSVAYSGLIQTDASINPGNSGGPLLNINSELIGINTAIRGDAQNIGFAIPVDRLWELLPMMLDIERRERVRFGLQVSGADAQVLAVRAGSPAEKAGLSVGDRIMKFDGDPLRDGIDYYVHLLGEKPGGKVQLTLQRGGKTVEREITLQAVPLPDGRKLAAEILGVTLEEISAGQRRELELPSHVGLVVAEVEDGSPADRAGVHSGDLILGIDRLSVPTLGDVGLALETARPGQPLLIEGYRLRSDPPFRWTVAIKARAAK